MKMLAILLQSPNVLRDVFDLIESPYLPSQCLHVLSLTTLAVLSCLSVSVFLSSQHATLSLQMLLPYPLYFTGRPFLSLFMETGCVVGLSDAADTHGGFSK